MRLYVWLFARSAAVGIFCCSHAVLALASPTGATEPAAPGSSTSVSSDSPALGEIVVTATKTGATALQKTPLAISAFSAAELAQSGVSSVKDLVEFAPGLALSQNNVNAEIYIRGVGSNNVYAGSDPDVTVQVDGVYIARPSAQFGEYLDVDRVEVLRGPQGTLYGRNAAGGTINVISRAPTDTFEAEEQLTLGNYYLVHEQALVSGPLVPNTLQASVAIDYINHRPYIDNVVGGQPGSGDANHGTIRGQLRFEPTDTVTATTRADYLVSDENIQASNHLLAPYLANGGAPIANGTIGNYLQEALNTPQSVYTHTGGVSEDVDVTLTPGLDLKSITAYRQDDFSGSLDSDSTERSLSVGRLLQEVEDQFSQELDLSGKASIFDFVTGAYYFHENDANGIVAVTPTVGHSTHPDIHTNSEAVFAQSTAHILSNVGLTLGVRYTHEEKSLDTNAATFNPVTGILAPGSPFLSHNDMENSAVTPKFGLDWQVTPDVLLYISATRGYKSGGFNYAATTVPTETFGPEKLWSYEAGAKTEFFDRRMRLNVTAFHYDYSSLQVQSLLAVGVTSIENAASAKVNGAEAELSVKPLAPLELTANLAYLDASYNTFINDAVPAALKPYVATSSRYDAANGTYDASGNYLNDAPRFSSLIAVQYSHEVNGDGSLFGRAEYSWKSRQYFDPTNASILSQDGFGLANVYMGYHSVNGTWGVKLFAKNVTGKQYIIAAAAQSLTPVGFVGQPRTYGITMTKNW
jgi:iron complex outermembrane receptor protein